MRLKRTSIALVALVLAAPGAALAQNSGSAGLSTFQSGYGGARQSVSAAQTGSTRDQNGNRLIIDGIIQGGASAYSRQSGGVSNTYTGAGGSSGPGAIGGSTAIGNNLNVVVQGSHNTVIVNSRQTNTGNVSARTDLTGTLTGFE